MKELEELSQICEHQRIVIEYLLAIIEATCKSLANASLEAQSQSTQTGTDEK